MRRQEAEKFDLRNLTGEARECLETLAISEYAVEIFGLTMVNKGEN